jgi:hypothetical protein
MDCLAATGGDRVDGRQGATRITTGEDSMNVVKFPINVSRRVHSRKPRRTSPVRILTGEKWEEIVACLAPEQQQAFMADVWKLLNRHFRKL